MQPRRAVRYTLALLLLTAAVVTFLTGLLVDRLDLNQFAPHRWAGYVLAGLVVIHVATRWRFFLTPRGTRHPTSASPPTPGIETAGAAGDRDRPGPTRR